MKHEALDVVVLVRDLPEHGLGAGDLGTVVERYPPGNLEVEFVAASGRTKALVNLSSDDVRPIADSDLVAVRSLEKLSDVDSRQLWVDEAQRRDADLDATPEKGRPISDVLRKARGKLG